MAGVRVQKSTETIPADVKPPVMSEIGPAKLCGLLTPRSMPSSIVNVICVSVNNVSIVP